MARSRHRRYLLLNF